MPLVKSTPIAPAGQSPLAPFLLHDVQVARRTVLSDGFVRVTFTGETLGRFADPGLDQRIKLILSAPDGTLDGLPFTDGWYPVWRSLPDDRRPIIRTYTTRAVRPDDREVDVDFVVHEPSGPAGRFAAQCAEGDRIVLLGPNTDHPTEPGGIDFRLPATARRVLIAGDETALPAIARILEALPAEVGGTVFVEVPHTADADQLPSHPLVAVQVLDRGDGVCGSLLAGAVRAGAETMLGVHRGREPEEVDVDSGILWEVPGEGALGVSDGTFYAWLAGEAGVIKALRRTLVADLGVDRRSVAFMGYWRLGRDDWD